MNALVKAELAKLRTTRSAWGLLLGMLGLVAIGTASVASESSAEVFADPFREQQFMLALHFTRLFVLVLGVKVVTDEFRYGTVVPTFLVTPRRSRVMAAKVVAAAVTGVVFTAVAAAFLVGLAALLVNGHGAGLTIARADVAVLGGVALSGGLWAAIGVGLGAVIRHQVAAVVGPVFWVMFGEELVAGRLGGLATYLPAQASVAVLAAWALAVWIAGSAVVLRRDVV